jgi:hypothetical protein
MTSNIQTAIAAFGVSAKAKLANPGASGAPEDQLRAPFEQLLTDFAEFCSLPKNAVTAVGESSVNALKTRPDYAVTVHKALVGFIELKAPGKGADPRKFKDPHDKEQWEKLHSLPNLLYTDGNAFSLWQDGQIVDSVITLVGDIESAGNKLRAPPGLLSLFEKFLRWQPIPPRTAKELAHTSSLIGAALRLLTENAENQATLKTSLGILTRVLDAVHWPTISKGKPETWLYFYEDFLEVYDNTLRKQTGSYYTPPDVVAAMVRLVDEVLRSPRFGQHAGIAAPAVTFADPATGTGTFVLSILHKIAETVKADEGEGAVNSAIDAAVNRLIAFEIQLGPFAVAQLRALAEIVDLTGAPPKTPLRMFVTDTLEIHSSSRSGCRQCTKPSVNRGRRRIRSSARSRSRL